MKKKRIMIVGLTLGFGGAERVISILSKALKSKYENVEILLYFDREICYEIDSNVKITIVEKNTHTENKLKNLFWMRNYIKKNADIVISFLAPLNMLVLVATAGLKVEKIVADRSDPRRTPSHLVLRKLRNFLYCFADQVVVQTKDNYAYFSKVVQRKAKIIYNPTSVKKEEKGIALQTEKENIVVCVGRIIEQKNPYMLLEAFIQFHKKFPEYKLVIYGEGELKPVIAKMVKERGVSEFVELPGTVKDIIPKIAKAKMFVMTSNFEGMPNALIEAMCIGLPCICTRVSGARDLIKQGENGILVKIGDIKTCCKAMETLAKNEKLASQLGRKATQLTESLSEENIVKQWIELF